MYPNQHADLPKFNFIEDSLKTKKVLELVSNPGHTFCRFFYKNSLFIILHKLFKFHYQTLTSHVIQ